MTTEYNDDLDTVELGQADVAFEAYLSAVQRIDSPTYERDLDAASAVMALYDRAAQSQVHHPWFTTFRARKTYQLRSLLGLS